MPSDEGLKSPVGAGRGALAWGAIHAMVMLSSR